jgi:leucyl-tRNA synthetase
MDTFVDSSWYFLRYCDPHNDTRRSTRAAIDEWMPVDEYIGGIEHAVMHLLYARYFIKVLNDLGLVGFREPFPRLFNHGWVDMGGAKMSKSRGNVVSPDDFVREFGADALRLYILFIGPADARVDWQETGLEGMARFLRRLWRVVSEVAELPDTTSEGALAHKAHETIAKVTDDTGRRYAYNTALAAIMELVNEITRDPSAPGARFAVETAVSLIQPAAPHVAEELWGAAGPRAAVGAAVADGRSVAAAAGHIRAGRAGERQGARPPGGPGRPAGGRAGRSRQGVAEGAGAAERRRDPADDRRAAQARQSRRQLGTDTCELRRNAWVACRSSSRTVAVSSPQRSLPS